MATVPSQECLDALAVWRPFALRHLLSLDPQPQIKLVDARRAVAAAKERYEHFSGIILTLASARTALKLLAEDEFVRTLPVTHSAIVDIVQRKMTGNWPTSRDLIREDVLSAKSETLDLVAYVLRYLELHQLLGWLRILANHSTYPYASIALATGAVSAALHLVTATPLLVLGVGLLAGRIARQFEPQ